MGILSDLNPIKIIKGIVKGLGGAAEDITRVHKDITKGVFTTFTSALDKVGAELFRAEEKGYIKRLLILAAVYFGGVALANAMAPAATATPGALSTGVSTAAETAEFTAAAEAATTTGVAEAALVPSGADLASQNLAATQIQQPIQQPVQQPTTPADVPVEGAPQVDVPIEGAPKVEIPGRPQAPTNLQAQLTEIPSQVPKEGGLWSQFKEGIAKNPVIPTVLAGNIIQAALSPDPIDPGQAQIDVEKWRRENSNIAGVNYDGSGVPIRYGLRRQARRDRAGRRGLVRQAQGSTTPISTGTELQGIA